MKWILGIVCWLFLAGLLLYLCVWVDYHFFTYDLLDRRAAQWVKHPYRVLAILCLLVSANLVLFAVKIATVTHRAIDSQSLGRQHANANKKLPASTTRN